MQHRRDLREDLNRNVVLDAELDFLIDANQIVQHALKVVVARVKAQYAGSVPADIGKTPADIGKYLITTNHNI